MRLFDELWSVSMGLEGNRENGESDQNVFEMDDGGREKQERYTEEEGKAE